MRERAIRLQRVLVGLVILAALPALTLAEPSTSDLGELASKAAQDDPVAQYNLGVEYYRGERVERNLEKAAALWKNAAAVGNVPASNSLAYLTFYGKGIPRDAEEGIRLWRYAAERGHAEAQFQLASVYMSGRHVSRSYVLAYAWASASVHYAEATTELGGDPEVTANARLLQQGARAALSNKQRELAETRAQEFIAVYHPRD